MENLEYTVVLEPNGDEPGYTVTVPALPGCVSCGETLEEALENIRDAIALWIRLAKKQGEPVPADTAVVSKVRVSIAA
ncbi:MAG: type II toxin-antitoxin system HicB family antitoxin [Dehalococcoidia bacterium]|nr:type II toxin-antitoxin system HicB family antitoxin [Dehalococcoidia bacterium]